MWRPEADAMLIDFYEQHRYLWDCHHKDYFKRDLKEQSLEQLVQLLGSTYSVAEVKKRWKHVRDGYMRKQRTLQAMKRSGARAEDIQRYIKKWENYQRLMFLCDAIVERTNASHLEKGSYQDILLVDEGTLDSFHESERVMALEESCSPVAPFGMTPLEPEPLPSASSPSEDTPPASRCWSYKTCCNMGKARDELLLSVARCLQPMPEDKFDHFGKYIANSLRELTPVAQKEVQLKFMQILMEYQDI